MINTEYDDFVEEALASAQNTVDHHKQQIDFADEQVRYWSAYKAREERWYADAYGNYLDRLKKALDKELPQ
jgi:hypothetical protein